MVASVVVPQIKVQGSDLGEDYAKKVRRVLVDQHLHLPDMFEIHFADDAGDAVIGAGIKIGTEIEILLGAEDSDEASPVMKGEVTAIEADMSDMLIDMVVRGYDKTHRLQRGRKTRSWPNSKCSKIAEEIANEYSLEIGTIDDSGSVHDLITQATKTDWEFLQELATELGFECGSAQGTFYFRKPLDPAGGGGGALGAVASMAPSLPGMPGPPLELHYRDKLRVFKPRISGAGLVSKVNVRGWDAKQKKGVVGKADANTKTAKFEESGTVVSGDTTAETVAKAFPAFSLPIQIPPILELLGLSFPGSDPGSHQLVNRPLLDQTNADKIAEGLAEHISSTIAEAEGIARGDPQIQPGVALDIKSVPAMFIGKWTVTQARHQVEVGAGGYTTHFVVSGRHTRTLLGLTNGSKSADHGFVGLVSAIVTDNKDPDKKGRVKVSFPWLEGTYVSDWTRVMQFGGGTKGGAMFIPEPKDEVLVGFEHGDIRRPYVIGAVYSPADKDAPKVPAVDPLGMVAWRSFESRNGSVLKFTEEMAKQAVTLGTKDDGIVIQMDAPLATPGGASIKQEKLKIEVKVPGGGGLITIDGMTGAIAIESKAPPGSKIEMGAGGQVKVTGTMINIEAKGNLVLKGAMVQIN